MSRLFETPTPRQSGSTRSLWEPRFTNRPPSPIRASTPTRESSRYPREDRDDSVSGEVVTLLKQLQDQIKSLQQQQMETSTTASKKIVVPKMLQSEVHHFAKELGERLEDPKEWDYTKQLTHPDNKMVTNEIVSNLTSENFSSSLVKRAAAVYFKTKQRQAIAAEKNTLAPAQKKQRKRQRKHNKLRKRKAACNTSTTLTSDEKTKLHQVLKVDFMSSEESEADSGSEREDGAARIFMRRPLPWRSQLLQTYIESLDRKAARRQSQRAKEMVVTRNYGAPSTREPPTDCPEWAINQNS